jgi:hypothetical protein
MIRYPVYEVELFERQFKSRSDWVVALDYYLLPRLDFGLPRIQLADRNGVEFESFRFDSLDYLYGMARRFRIRRSA